MFVLTLGNTNESDKMLDEIKSYQIDLFSDLNVSFKVLNMSSEELGKILLKYASFRNKWNF